MRDPSFPLPFKRKDSFFSSRYGGFIADAPLCPPLSRLAGECFTPPFRAFPPFFCSGPPRSSQSYFFSPFWLVMGKAEKPIAPSIFFSFFCERDAIFPLSFSTREEMTFPITRGAPCCKLFPASTRGMSRCSLPLEMRPRPLRAR